PHSTVFTLEQIPRTWGLFSQWRIRVEGWPTLSVKGPQAQAANINSQPMANGTNAVPVLFPLQYGVGFNQKYVKSAATTGIPAPARKLISAKKSRSSSPPAS
ncbi:hypothetical protein CJ199_16495, partial [Brevibacterium paucivorans]